VSTNPLAAFQAGVLPGQHEEPRFQDAPQVGRVVAVSAKGATVELDGQRGWQYGPAPWSLGSYDSFALALIGGFHPAGRGSGAGPVRRGRRRDARCDLLVEVSPWPSISLIFRSPSI
jgi:hypothetical protein